MSDMTKQEIEDFAKQEGVRIFDPVQEEQKAMNVDREAEIRKILRESEQWEVLINDGGSLVDDAITMIVEAEIHMCCSHGKNSQKLFDAVKKAIEHVRDVQAEEIGNEREEEQERGAYEEDERGGYGYSGRW